MQPALSPLHYRKLRLVLSEEGQLPHPGSVGTAGGASHRGHPTPGWGGGRVSGRGVSSSGTTLMVSKLWWLQR